VRGQAGGYAEAGRADGGHPVGAGRRQGGARSHCRFAPPLIHFIPDSLNIFDASLSDPTMRPDPSPRPTSQTRGRSSRCPRPPSPPLAAGLQRCLAAGGACNRPSCSGVGAEAPAAADHHRRRTGGGGGARGRARRRRRRLLRVLRVDPRGGRPSLPSSPPPAPRTRSRSNRFYGRKLVPLGGMACHTVPEGRAPRGRQGVAAPFMELARRVGFPELALLLARQVL
jgi:hypothetical protein